MDPRRHGGSDIVFAVLLCAGAALLALFRWPAWVAAAGVSILVAFTAAFLTAMWSKYASVSAEAGAPPPRVDDYLLLALPWAGLAVAVAGDLLAMRLLDVVGTALSMTAGALILFDARLVVARLVESDHAMAFVLKPGWLHVRSMSRGERRAWVRATGMAWVAGGAADILFAFGVI